MPAWRHTEVTEKHKLDLARDKMKRASIIINETKGDEIKDSVLQKYCVECGKSVSVINSLAWQDYWLVVEPDSFYPCTHMMSHGRGDPDLVYIPKNCLTDSVLLSKVKVATGESK